MRLNILSFESGISYVGSVSLSDSIFALKPNNTLIHQVTTSYRSNSRIAQSVQKSRSSVKHSTRKPWVQKGSGRARAGMSSSPIWRGGGRAFPCSLYKRYSVKINKKAYKKALQYILSDFVTKDKLFIVNEVLVLSTKTRLTLTSNMYMNIAIQRPPRPVLIVVEKTEMNVEMYLVLRNVRGVSTMSYAEVNPYNLLLFNKAFFTLKGILKLQESL
ncbi:50S ribosomal protein L4 [Candidatus Tremblaya phenacola]|uniref:Large ribosomal subunit protein uL4 n=1 Tax=Candidatus Tremblayella phenacoccinincola TaxID=1010676 RepID=A0A2G0V6W4_9PROT|nr:50S ribosomal protein L4 [Candidatus Tremblaya phenacola]PHN16214.1 50S ribosomal protein L4 [Candidatus Tremblaya phenacola]